MKRIAFSLMMIAFSLPTQGDALCQGHFVNPMTDICWRCLFPLSIGSTPMATGGIALPDTENPASPIQVCPTEGLPRVGLAIGYWEPVALVDITAKPYCMVNLGGVQFDLGTDVSQGGRSETDGDRHHSFYHAHWYNYPVLEWLHLLDDAICMQKGDFDLSYLSELDPTWDDDELSFLINPEATLFSSVLLQASWSIN
jgi:conjugal transfer pilus assembly protein TraU